MRLLGHGVDTLVLNLYWETGQYALPEGLEDKLKALKELARVAPHDAVLWGVDAYLPMPNYSLDPEGGVLYESALVLPAVRHYAYGLSMAGQVFWRLSAPSDTVRRKTFPAVRVELAGAYMMYAGRRVEEVVTHVVEAAANLVGSRPIRVQVSRIDLFADVEVPSGYFKVEDLARFTSRSRVRGLYCQAPAAEGRQAPAPGLEGGPMSNTPPATRLLTPDSWEEGPGLASAWLRGRQWSGFTFGRGPLMARVYSKTVEAASKPLTRLLLRGYEDAHGPITGEVVRVEFQLVAEALGEMVVAGDGADMRDWDTIRWAMPSVWSYLTGSWLVLHDVGNYSQVRDAPIDAAWRLVQGAFEGGDRGNIVRYKWQGSDVLGLLRQAVGAFSTAVALVGKLLAIDTEAVWRALFRAVATDEDTRKRLDREGAAAYRMAIRRRIARFGLMPEVMRYGGTA